ncbi:DUF3993 domain-containing protein [uncultured Metabacillus sp.]|uniref:DUF3993 domain-containing protein n=1 Tax=uncultured Metabacillus sp. TaxID=2860135 RepID=UPI00262FFEAA|nr:DUF3993 domain-containing protein [uncultured Metabacillus sp.]
MKQNFLSFSLLLLIAIFSFSHEATAKELEGNSKAEILNHIQDAFQAQTSLTEKPRSLYEMRLILTPYFENELIKKYMDANVQPIEDQFIVYGTDFPVYTIPFFSYDEHTKVVEEGNQRIIYEFFQATSDGPVEYEDHYELVKMRKTNGSWKIYSIDSQKQKPKLVKDTMRSEDYTTSNMINNTSFQPLIQALNNDSSLFKHSFLNQSKVLFFSLMDEHFKVIQ